MEPLHGVRQEGRCQGPPWSCRIRICRGGARDLHCDHLSNWDVCLLKQRTATPAQNVSSIYSRSLDMPQGSYTPNDPRDSWGSFQAQASLYLLHKHFPVHTKSLEKEVQCHLSLIMHFLPKNRTFITIRTFSTPHPSQRDQHQVGHDRSFKYSPATLMSIQGQWTQGNQLSKQRWKYLPN